MEFIYGEMWETFVEANDFSLLPNCEGCFRGEVHLVELING